MLYAISDPTTYQPIAPNAPLTISEGNLIEASAEKYCKSCEFSIHKNTYN